MRLCWRWRAYIKGILAVICLISHFQHVLLCHISHSSSSPPYKPRPHLWCHTRRWTLYFTTVSHDVTRLEDWYCSSHRKREQFSPRPLAVDDVLSYFCSLLLFLQYRKRLVTLWSFPEWGSRTGFHTFSIHKRGHKFYTVNIHMVSFMSG